MTKIAFLLFILSFQLLAQDAVVTPLPQEKTQEEKEVEDINFDILKKVLKNDLLDKEVKKKVDQVQQIKETKQDKELQRFFFPVKEDFWGFFSEFWVVKNVQELKWDFEKPDYGINEAVLTLFRAHGFLEKKIKVLILNSPHLSHLGLPGNGNESFILISLPFIRSMDLTKQEIAMLILEDFIRLEAGYLQTYVSSKELVESFGRSYPGKTIDPKYLNESLDKLTDFVMKKGFNFQEQFDVTKKMDILLKSNQANWNTYIQLLNKMDKLVKMNLIYENHIRLYPSPEMQIKWLSPSPTPIP